MNKLTADRCKQRITELQFKRDNQGMSNQMYDYLEAMEIALPVLEQQEAQCEKCNGTGQMDSGGTQPWGEQILIECDCKFEQQETESDGWIEWGGGPVAPVTGMVEVRWSDGSTDIGNARIWRWEHCKFMARLIAYRIIQEQPTNQNGAEV